MPRAPIVPGAGIFPLLAAVTPRSRYLKKERRPATRGAVVGVAYASLPGGFTAAGRPIGVLASFIMEASSSWYRQCYPIHAQIEVLRWSWRLNGVDGCGLMAQGILSPARRQAAEEDCPNPSRSSRGRPCHF